MKEDSPWKMEVCEYCFERMHRDQIEEHRNLIHREVMEAESIVKGLADHEKKGLLAVCGWIGLETFFVFILYALDVDASMPWILTTAGIFIGILLIGLVVHFSTPKQVKEARKKAGDILLKRLVKCEVCGSMVPYEDYSDHIRRNHPRKRPYEWYRGAIMALLLIVGGGGYVALSLLAEMERLSDRGFILLITCWIGGSCLIFLWMIYEYHVGELRHIQKMRRHWEEHRYDPGENTNE